MTVYILAITFSLFSTAAGQVLFKYYHESRQLVHLIGAVLLFICVPLTNFVALRGLPFGIVYMSTAVTQILVLIMSYLFLKERVPVRAVPGIACIVLGIVVYAL